jgi:hypothetical protein
VLGFGDRKVSDVVFREAGWGSRAWRTGKWFRFL